MLTFLTALPIITFAQTFTDYQSNLKIEVPVGWSADTYEDTSMRIIGIKNNNFKDEPIIIFIKPLTKFQSEAKFFKYRSLANFSEELVAELIESNIQKIKEDDVNAQVLLSQVMHNPHNKSIFIVYDSLNKAYRELNATTLLNGIKFDIVTRLNIPDKDGKTEKLTPVFLEIVKSMQSAY
jgi:hypothetical protein